jgi:hypothetical protein
MSRLLIPITLLLLFSTVHADLSFSSFTGDFSSYDPATSGIPLSDIITVANYYGCKTWVKNQCTECSQGYYFNKNGVCCEVPSLCSQFNRAEGICLACYQGYAVVNGSCTVDQSNNGCAVYNGAFCSQCSKGWWQNSQGVCVAVSDQCATWNQTNGFCLTCYGGYVLTNGVCAVNPNPFNGGNNALCAQWNGTNCLKCAARAYFNSFGVCTAVSDQCQTFDPLDGSCLSCYAGYKLDVSRACVLTPGQQPSDLGCKSWNSAQNVCLACSQRYFFNGSVCVPVSDQCATWNLSGSCLTCYGGYDLLSGKCQVSANSTNVTDLGCATWDWNKRKCLACSSNWIFNSNGVCVPVSDQCATFNAQGACLTCYKGYQVSNGKCQLAPADNNVTDLGCATWDWNNKKCLACSSNWVFNNAGQCVPVSDQCASSNAQGACLTCYKGYNLNNGKCQLAPINTPTDLGCASWDWNNKKCLACSSNWVFNNNGVCVQVSDQCASSNAQGACVSCYKGYNLSNGKCQLAPIENPIDLGCATWDWNGKKCLACSTNWVFNTAGQCVQISDQCASSNAQGACLSCYKGYNLSNGKCQLAPIDTPSDLGCALWDWNNKNCLQCSTNWVFNNNKVCVPVSDQCATFNAQGACLTCYKGYQVSNGKCQLAPADNNVTDLGCATWDWNNKKCLACSSNWVFNNAGQCVPVSDQCASSNAQGACLTCYKGYNLNNGKCQLAPVQQVTDIGCATWDWDKSKCLACSFRYVLNSNSGKCVPVNDNCQQWNSAGACTQCFTGYVLSNGLCTLGNSLCQNSTSGGACTTCYTGYILDNGNCVPISKLASLALYYSQCCP